MVKSLKGIVSLVESLNKNLRLTLSQWVESVDLGGEIWDGVTALEEGEDIWDGVTALEEVADP